MTGKRRILISLVFAVALGALISLPLSERRQISIELWLVAASSWLALSIVLHVLDEAPVIPGRLRALWHRPGSTDRLGDLLPRGLLALEGTMISARDSDRAYALRLRPRLQQVTDHHLRNHLGIDVDREPDRARAALGEVAWLVEEDLGGRTPTVPEIEQLLRTVSEPREPTTSRSRAPADRKDSR